MKVVIDQMGTHPQKNPAVHVLYDNRSPDIFSFVSVQVFQNNGTLSGVKRNASVDSSVVCSYYHSRR